MTFAGKPTTAQIVAAIAAHGTAANHSDLLANGAWNDATWMGGIAADGTAVEGRLDALENLTTLTYTPTIRTSGGSTPNLGSTGSATGSYYITSGWCHGHAELIWRGSGVTAGTAGQVYSVSLPVLGQNPTTASPATTAYVIGVGKIGRVFGTYERVVTVYMPPTAPTGQTIARTAQFIVGNFEESGTATFAASTTKTVAHGLGTTPTKVQVTSQSQTTGLLTATADATNVTVTAASSTSASFFWSAGLASSAEAIVTSSHPWGWSTADDHIEFHFSYPVG